MHRNRILALAREAIPAEARHYTGHVARLPDPVVACPNCNATKGLALTRFPTCNDARYWGSPFAAPAPLVALLVVSCPDCQTFTAMEVTS